MPENPIAEFYKLFGLTQTASIDEIIQARRFLALEFHPDRGGSDEHMALVNLAFDEIMNWHRQQQPEPLHISIPKLPLAFDVDRPSFVISALPVVAFELLLLAGRIIGDVALDDPPYLLEVQIEDPVLTWCRLEVLPESGSSSVSLMVDGQTNALSVRDLWIRTINEIGFAHHERP
jgi:hypothetical protein